MTTYSTDELVSSSTLIKNFWNYVAKVTNHELDKIWILKNNKLDAVIISKDTYEMFEEMLEHIDIYNSVKERLHSENKTISFEEMAKIHNIK